jgi:hypothetical protein
MAIISEGEVVLEGDPQSLLENARGKVWSLRVARDEVASYRTRYPVITVRLSGGEPLIHVWSDDTPGDGFQPVEPQLEDIYFHHVGAAAMAEA